MYYAYSGVQYDGGWAIQSHSDIEKCIRFHSPPRVYNCTTSFLVSTAPQGINTDLHIDVIIQMNATTNSTKASDVFASIHFGKEPETNTMQVLDSHHHNMSSGESVETGVSFDPFGILHETCRTYSLSNLTSGSGESYEQRLYKNGYNASAQGQFRFKQLNQTPVLLNATAQDIFLDVGIATQNAQHSSSPSLFPNKATIFVLAIILGVVFLFE
eukprot:Nk52_evm5s240 gene=Nk52_evmTU5s240